MRRLFHADALYLDLEFLFERLDVLLGVAVGVADLDGLQALEEHRPPALPAHVVYLGVLEDLHGVRREGLGERHQRREDDQRGDELIYHRGKKKSR